MKFISPIITKEMEDKEKAQGRALKMCHRKVRSPVRVQGKARKPQCRRMHSRISVPKDRRREVLTPLEEQSEWVTLLRGHGRSSTPND